MPGMEPAPKSPAVEALLEQMFGRSTAIRALRCVKAPVGCGREIDPGAAECWDEVTLAEYRLSGLCSTCQDEVFGDDT